MINLFSLFIKNMLYSCIALMLFACKIYAQEAKTDSSGMLTLRIDPQYAHGANISQVFDEVNFIPLETTKESLFGSIAELKFVKNQFIIHDNDTRAILIFTKEGKFKVKIDASKMVGDDGDQSKTALYGYTIVEDNKDSVIVIYSGKYNFFFDFNGKQIKKLLRKDFKYNRDYKFADKETVVRPDFVQKKGKDSTNYEFAILGKKDTLAYFPYSLTRYQNDDIWDSAKFYDYEVGNEFFFLNNYGSNIYKITPYRFSLAYRIIFPAVNTLPQDFRSNPVYLKKRGEYFKNNPKVFFSLNNTYQIGDNLYMQMRSYSPSNEAKQAIIYNLKTTDVTSLQDLEPDSLSSFLPVTDLGASYEFLNKGFLLFKNGYFYTSYSSLAMFKFKEQLGDKHKQFSPLMTAYFKTQDRKSNPVIIQLKPKK